MSPFLTTPWTRPRFSRTEKTTRATSNAAEKANDFLVIVSSAAGPRLAAEQPWSPSNRPEDVANESRTGLYCLRADAVLPKPCVVWRTSKRRSYLNAGGR